MPKLIMTPVEKKLAAAERAVGVNYKRITTKSRGAYTVRSTTPGLWHLRLYNVTEGAYTDLAFHRLRSSRGGCPGQRYTYQVWSVPGSDVTAMSLTGAVRAAVRAGAVGRAIGRALGTGWNTP